MGIWVFFGVWLVLWVVSWAVLKYGLNYQKQVIGAAWLVSLFIYTPILYLSDYLFEEPTEAELKAEAQEAGDLYLLVSQTDAPNKEKCSLAKDALQKYQKVNDEYFIRIMAYSVKLECR